MSQRHLRYRFELAHLPASFFSPFSAENCGSYNGYTGTLQERPRRYSQDSELSHSVLVVLRVPMALSARTGYQHDKIACIPQFRSSSPSFYQIGKTGSIEEVPNSNGRLQWLTIYEHVLQNGKLRRTAWATRMKALSMLAVASACGSRPRRFKALQSLARLVAPRHLKTVILRFGATLGSWFLVAKRLRSALCEGLNEGRQTKYAKRGVILKSPRLGHSGYSHMGIVPDNTIVPLIGGSSRGSPVSPASSFRRCSILTSITLIVSYDLVVESRPNLFTHFSSFPREDECTLRIGLNSAETIQQCKINRLQTTLGELLNTQRERARESKHTHSFVQPGERTASRSRSAESRQPLSRFSPTRSRAKRAEDCVQSRTTAAITTPLSRGPSKRLATPHRHGVSITSSRRLAGDWPRGELRALLNQRLRHSIAEPSHCRFCAECVAGVTRSTHDNSNERRNANLILANDYKGDDINNNQELLTADNALGNALCSAVPKKNTIKTVFPEYGENSINPGWRLGICLKTRRGIIPNSFYQFPVTFSGSSPTENGYFDVRTVLNTGYIHMAQQSPDNTLLSALVQDNPAPFDIVNNVLRDVIHENVRTVQDECVRGPPGLNAFFFLVVAVIADAHARACVPLSLHPPFLLDHEHGILLCVDEHLENGLPFHEKTFGIRHRNVGLPGRHLVTSPTAILDVIGLLPLTRVTFDLYVDIDPEYF
ncbi:hypothetical protein PR048_030219 [Dryococelus australis]|uniref:Uncharacterized protein n=1 Tax=Dryococelus australis TaxID=614101 RepID=A0ABQ9G8C6_9NEOP|nr:hypothetical protein PR048_030219 [Dryococelus australis]